MTRSHSFQNLLDHIDLAPECEAGPLSTQHPALMGEARYPAEQGSTRLSAPGTPAGGERLGLAWKAAWWAVMLLAAAVVAHNSRIPAAPATGSAPGSAALYSVQHIDHAEQCLVIRYLDDQGRERHKHTHCPAVQSNGLFALPLARLQEQLREMP